MINELVQNLIAINNITEGQELSFADALSIVEIYDKMPEPNNLIDEAEEMATYDIDALEKSVIKLKEESERFLNVCLPKLNDVDFKAIAQDYSRTFYNRYQKAEKELTAYWKAYCQLNNRLDYLDLDSQEYIEAEKLCEEAKAKHDERQKTVQRLYAEYEQANKESAPVFWFRADFPETVIVRYHDIASAILTDIKRIRECGS
ncbi:hypothetical protein [uncultured Muribaculum sp.]|uniref:hypothetical protein n=1 Tax=uncultured Muribaculum sp. TaxID=1918613 RepID=UPI00263A896A|nr:hypothetical protein [uncultured Muribaculum sp.]